MKKDINAKTIEEIYELLLKAIYSESQFEQEEAIEELEARCPKGRCWELCEMGIAEWTEEYQTADPPYEPSELTLDQYIKRKLRRMASAYSVGAEYN